MAHDIDNSGPVASNLKGIYAYLECKPLSLQEEHFLLLYMQGMSIAAAERGTGMNTKSGNALLRREGTTEIIDYLRHQVYGDVRITREQLTTMALEAHRKSQSSTEELMAIRDIAKLNEIGGFATTPTIVHRLQKQEERKEEKDITPKSIKALETMDENKLMDLAAFDGLDQLDPVPIVRKPKAEDDAVVETIPEGEAESVDE